MEISLSGLSWELKGYWPYVPVKEKSMETGQTLQGVTNWIPAKVPGGVHYDLWKAGLIEDPYFGQNSLKCSDFLMIGTEKSQHASLIITNGRSGCFCNYIKKGWFIKKRLP